jgi:hypothetical protein
LNVKDPFAIAVAAPFGAPPARPRVVGGYAVRTGWVEINRGPELTDSALRELKLAVYSVFEARWRRRVKEISLARIS